MNSKENISEKILTKTPATLVPEDLLKLGVPGTLSRLKEIVQELENEQNELELQKDDLENARKDLALLLDQYTNLYNIAPIGYLTFDKSGLILEINQAGALLFGTERSDLINQNIEQFISTDFLPEYTNFLENLFTNHSQEMIEFKIPRMEDEIVLRISAHENKDKTSCIASIVDITLEEKARLLEKDEHKYRTIFENITHGIVLCGLDGKIVSANKAAKNILGLTFNQTATRPLLELFSNPEYGEERAFLGEKLPFMKVLNLNKETKDVTIGIIPKNSTHYTWIVVSAMSVSMPDEEDVQFLVSFEDITSQKNLLLYNKLTIREKQVFQMLTKGYGRKEIGEILDITSKTVDKHRENLMEKLKIYLPEDLLDFSKKL